MMSKNTVNVPGVGEAMPISAPDHSGHSHSHGHGDSHSHGHGHGGHGHGHGGHGHHAHAHQAGEDQWDGQRYIAKPGAKEVAVVSADRILYALQQVGISKEDTKSLNLLEVGCGPGLVTANLAHHFSSIHAIEVSPSMLLAFSTVNSSPTITHSLHYLNPSSSSDFLTPLLSPLPSEPERRLTPPRARFDVAATNLVLHHVDDWSDIMRGIQGLLGPAKEGGKGGWFVGTEFGIGEDGTDVVMEARAKMGLVKGDKSADHASIHHGAMTPSQMIAKLESYGFEEAHAEIKGEMKLWPDAPAVPCLVFWARAPAGAGKKEEL